MNCVIDLCSKLINYESTTPAKRDVFDFLASFLYELGFETKILSFSSESGNIVYNLFAKRGNPNSQKSLGFLGHIDVVPAGDNWNSNPFNAEVKDGYLIGRGVADMKSGIAAFLSAVQKSQSTGCIEIFITGDEEVGSYEGTQALLHWMQRNEKFPSCCLIGEPSSINRTGDRVYLGHRGSINVRVVSEGKQGHVAFPSNFDNALSKLCKYISKMKSYQWIYKDTRFPRTNLEPTMLNNKNIAVNVVSDMSSANINVRFSGDYTFETLKRIFQENNNDDLKLQFDCSAEAYCCENNALNELISASIFENVGIYPVFSAAGGTSDGRFMKDYCDVIEFGVPDTTIHQKNEKVKISDIEDLERVYITFMSKYFL